MCTATWFAKQDGFELFFNRDERLSRLPALPPSKENVEGVGFLSPTDQDAGGTWILVNEFGLALALLNAWQVSLETPADGFLSRGLLVRALAASCDFDDLERRLALWDLGRSQGFSLLAFSGDQGVREWAFDGHSLKSRVPTPPVVSSSRDRSEAFRQRSIAFDRYCCGIKPVDRRRAFEAFHRSKDPEPGPWAVCMCREDARTVSLSHVVVDPVEVRFRYAPGPPDETPFGEALVLARRSSQAL